MRTTASWYRKPQSVRFYEIKILIKMLIIFVSNLVEQAIALHGMYESLGSIGFYVTSHRDVSCGQ